MQVILNLSPATDTGESGEYVFAKERISIGRDASCDLVLPDTKRIVSKEHAAIELGPAGYALTDLGSKNFTFLNGTRLAAGTPQPLAEGDVIRIGEFELTFGLAEEQPAARDDRTVFLINPFDVPAAQLADLLDQIEQAYQTEVPGRREEALRQAMRVAVADRRDSLRLVTEAVLGEEHAVAAESAEVVAPRAPEPVRRAPRRPHPAVPETPAPVRESARPAYEPGSAYERVFDVLIQMVPRLLGVPWRFRHEFIGQTIMHSPDAAALFEGGPEEVRRYLLDPNVSEEESERRALLLKEAADDLLMHALAMVDGYKGSVQEGMSRMLDEVDPVRVEEEVLQRGTFWDKLPIIQDVRMAQRIREKAAELRKDDWTVAERRVYRPAFIKAYLARMTSRRRGGD